MLCMYYVCGHGDGIRGERTWNYRPVCRFLVGEQQDDIIFYLFFTHTDLLTLVISYAYY